MHQLAMSNANRSRGALGTGYGWLDEKNTIWTDMYWANLQLAESMLFPGRLFKIAAWEEKLFTNSVRLTVIFTSWGAISV